MIRLTQINLPVGHSEEDLWQKAAKELHIKKQDISALHIRKQSIDARKKPEVFYSYTLDIETSAEKRILSGKHSPKASLCTEKPYVYPVNNGKYLSKRPVIVGFGPAGMFCAYFLALAGQRPIILERGQKVEERSLSVEKFWQTGELNLQSNVQFGEGGAGTFSDGKLNTLVKDKDGRNRVVMELFVKFGAPEKILWDAKPHIGTDVLKNVVRNMREEILALGGEFYFETPMSALILENQKVIGVKTADGKTFETDVCILAIGHSARDTFEKLLSQGIPMEAKDFAVGFRTEHPQTMINESQYGDKESKVLGAAPYKVVAQTPEGRGVYSFCMCPGGYVVNASSETERLCVNGMSYSGRDGQNANSAIIVSVSKADFPDCGPLSGMMFQREIEARAYRAGKGAVPVQTLQSFRKNVNGELSEPDEGKTYEPMIKGAYTYADLTGILTREMNLALVHGFENFGRQIQGFDRPDTLLSGIEARTSSPVRINRNSESLESDICGLYPCGEGAGYAGGITSAAMDGIRIAEKILESRVR